MSVRKLYSINERNNHPTIKVTREGVKTFKFSLSPYLLCNLTIHHIYYNMIHTCQNQELTKTKEIYMLTETLCSSSPNETVKQPAKTVKKSDPFKNLKGRAADIKNAVVKKLDGGNVKAVRKVRFRFEM
jgi:uncharacterized protein with ATP-grasp and redox domains